MAAGQQSGFLFSDANIKWFVVFRLCFHARFYYPVYAILFLDFGLTIEQFAILNGVWAIAVVCVEVPSGAFADLIGRRNILMFGSLLMITEMLLLCFTPVGSSFWLFMLMLLNRAISGAAEAAVSGSDEALAYDSLKNAGRESEWPKVLDLQMRVQSAGFIIVMTLGAAVYDLHWLGALFRSGWSVPVEVSHRLPQLLTLLMAFGAFYSAFKMREPEGQKRSSNNGNLGGSTWRQIIESVDWIRSAPFALVILAVSLSFESIILMFLTYASKYYEIIGLPVVTFGLIGSVMAVRGFIVPPIAAKMVEAKSAKFNFGVVAVLLFIGLGGITLKWTYIGLVFPAFIMFAMTFIHFLPLITSIKKRILIDGRRCSVSKVLP